MGRHVRANDEPATIVGVMPAGFAFPSHQEAWLPVRASEQEFPRGSGAGFTVFGRLKRGTTLSQARAEFAAIGARLARDFPDTNRNLAPQVQPYTERMSGGPDMVTSMVLTMAMGFAVLLIARANVANLLFARAASRTREIAIRSALGASRRRLAVQQLVETLVLAVAGTGVGLVVAWIAIDLLNRAVVDTNPSFWIVIRLDRGPLLFAVALTGLAALLSGGLPAWRASRPAINDVLQDGVRSTGGLRIGRISRVLITAKLVLSFALPGIALNRLISGLMRTMVFHVQPDDAAVFLVILGTLVGAAALAAFVPARRALRVDPAVTLRDQ